MDHNSMQNSSMASSHSMSTSAGHSMPMVFTDAHNTPLFSRQWTPTTTGAYAGTCIFLIVLAVISRMLNAYRHVLEAKWHIRETSRQYVASLRHDQAQRGHGPAVMLAASETSTGSSLSDEKAPDSQTRAPGHHRAVQRTLPPPTGFSVLRWNYGRDLPRACVFTLQHGVGYLLMLAVMTLNVGYFMSVLTGLFVGELLLGRYSFAMMGHQN